MKSRKPLLSTLAAGAFLLTGTLIAQNSPPPPQPPPSGQDVAPAPPPAPTIGPAPPFEQLSGGKKSISADQAVAYPPLANDFLHADTNRDGHISKTEYTNWTKQP